MEEQQGNDMRRKRPGRKRRSGIRTLTILSVLIGIIVCAYLIMEKYIPSFDIIGYQDYHEQPSGSLALVLGEDTLKSDPAPIIMNETLFLPVDFVKNHVDKYIFWDDGAEKLTITTENKVMRMKTDELTYYVNNKPFQLNLPVVKEGGSAYMPAELIMELYHIDIQYDDEFDIVIADYRDAGRTIGQVTSKKTNMRYEPDIKSPIADKLLLNEQVVLYDEYEQFTKVRTSDGRIGYIQTKDLTETDYIEPTAPEQVPSPAPAKPIEGKIIMAWDQVTTVEANANESRRISHEGLNVLSPTWFSFDDETMNGDIVNIADINYVKWAHENGYQVWALITDNFDGDVCHAALSDTEIREHVIKQLLAFISMYNLNGINVDFEAVRKDDAEYYLQFFRELAPLMREQGAVLSVDMYVPSEWSMYYNRTEVGKAVDYVCVMAYDEYWAGSEESGPVASIGFVENGVKDTLDEVPKEKVIMGMPFYNRVWREEEVDGEITRTVSHYGLAYTYELFIENGVEFVWLEDKGCYYGEYNAVEDGQEVTYKVWLEDERSIELKLEVFKKYDLAGVSCWKRGLEKPGIWELISEYR